MLYNVVKELIEVVPLGFQITIATSANADLGRGVGVVSQVKVKDIFNFH